MQRLFRVLLAISQQKNETLKSTITVVEAV